MNTEDTDDSLRSKWQELVKDATLDITALAPSSYSHVVLWADRETKRIQLGLCNATGQLDIMATRLKAIEAKMGIVGANNGN